MNRSRNYRHFPRHQILAALAALVMMAPNGAWATNSCVQVDVVADMAIIAPLVPGPDPVAVGFISYTFPDGVRLGTATAYLLEPPKYTEDGTVHLSLNAVHEFPNGDSFTWRADQVHSPIEVPGENRVNERVNMVESTGAYSESFGRGTGHGTSSYNTLTARIEASPRICNFSN